jgi:putative oxidoreductase
MKSTQTTTNIALLALRLILATVFIFHGSQKLFGWFGGYGLTATGQYMESIGIPFGTASAFLAGSTEFFGGILLLAGVLIPFVTIPMVFAMLVASFVAHGGGFSTQTGGMEYPLTLAVTSASLGLLGGGDWTLERFFKKPGTARIATHSTTQA